DAIADGKDVIALTATVKDDYGNAINQGDVNWKVIPAGNYHLSANTQATNAQGKSTVTIASEDVVACKAVATFNNVSLTSGTRRFIADVTTETVTDLTASKTTDIVAGKDVITLQATVKDASGNPVNNETVYWDTDKP